MVRILLVANAFNSLTQRVYTALRARDHHIGIELALGDDLLRARVAAFRPELILAPMLTTAIPIDIWSAHTVLIVHPGPKGDRGPSSLDWAIHEGEPEWGVTVLQAAEEMDAGPIWASVSFTVAPCGKSELYRNEVADAAVQAVLLAVDRFDEDGFEPEPLDYHRPDVLGQLRPYHDQQIRRIDWSTDDTAVVLRKLRAADSQPGVLDELYGREYYLHGGHGEDQLRGVPGTVIAVRDGAICRATVDGAVWVPQLRPRRVSGGPPTFKQPATDALGLDLPASIPEVPVTPSSAAIRETWSELRYREEGTVGYLEFSFPGGAMSTRQCRNLLAAFQQAATRPVDVLVLGPARDFFSNGIHLNVIEAAEDPAEESWLNINAMNDLVEAVLTTTDKFVISALAGNAAAGGVMFALAADEVWCRESVVLNPHYRLMGLHGSEYWTYTLPQRVGATEAERLTREALPLGARDAAALGLVDRVLPGSAETFWVSIRRAAAELAGSPNLANRLVTKKQRRAADEAAKPLAAYRSAELAQMRRNFFTAGEPYHERRRNFVYKVRPTQTPPHLLG
ncbi:enoyl-CoA hydratase-related protein [Nocardia sp. NPDC049190]|uniref:enoyl-CoA hydratase-related protein n=1 Tax=Nocardia sp. NPDC049190 TaxID=3155650 RepID=UPI0033E4B02C